MENAIIDKDVFKIESDERHIEKMLKKVRLCNGGTYGRECVFNYFFKSYIRNLTNLATFKSLKLED